MPFEYVCEECGFRIFPRKRFEVEKCRICGSPVKPKYFCRKCKTELSHQEILKNENCPSCGEKIPKENLKEKLEPGHSEKAKMENGKLTVEIEGSKLTSLEDINEVSLKILGVEIGRIENPDFAEFSSIKNYEETEEGVDLHFLPNEEEKFINKIEELKESEEEEE